MSRFSIDCIAFKALHKNSLIGFADIVIRELHLTIHDVSLHTKGAAKWASPPGKPRIKDGAVLTGDDGKVLYSPVLEFEDRATRDAFSAAVWHAVERFAPEAVA